MISSILELWSYLGSTYSTGMNPPNVAGIVENAILIFLVGQTFVWQVIFNSHSMNINLMIVAHLSWTYILTQPGYLHHFDLLVHVPTTVSG